LRAFVKIKFFEKEIKTLLLQVIHCHITMECLSPPMTTITMSGWKTVPRRAMALGGTIAAVTPT